MKNKEIDQQIMKILDLKEIRRFVCDTDKGHLKLLIRKGETNYHLVLDAVPLSKEVNKELMDLLFPAKQMDVPQVNKVAFNKVVAPKTLIEDTGRMTSEMIEVDTAHSHKGRPKGSKKK